MRGFKKAMNDGENEENDPPPKQIRSEGTDAEFPEVAKNQNREAGTAKTRSSGLRFLVRRSRPGPRAPDPRAA